MSRPKAPRRAYPEGKAQACFLLPEKLIERMAILAVRTKKSRSEVAETLLTLGLRRSPKAESSEIEAELPEAAPVVP